jgi:DNA-binding Lrp family transcriptional regulator
MQVHPDAMLFRLMNDSEYEQLKKNIAEFGLREEIVLDHTGEFLVDGRNRDRACSETGVAQRYKHLDPNVDIFSYVISMNFVRRHLSDDEQGEIIKEIAKRNPDASNRAIAEMTGVAPTTVIKHRSTVQEQTVDRKTKGRDGKLRPASNKVIPDKKEAVIAALKRNPNANLQQLADKHGVSKGSVSGYKRRMKEAGELTTTKIILDKQAERRKENLQPFDTLSREERGMGSREHGAEQHPDYPPGWTRDVVHREIYGRVQLFTPDKHAERKLAASFIKAIGLLAEFNREAPLADNMDIIDIKSLEACVVHFSKLGPPVIERVQSYLTKIAGKLQHGQSEAANGDDTPVQTPDSNIVSLHTNGIQ